MLGFSKLFGFWACIALVATGAADEVSAATGFAIGDDAPDFQLVDPDGAPRSLS